MMHLMQKRAQLSFTTLRNRSDEYKTDLVQSMQKALMPAFESGDLHLQIDSVFKISEASQALDRMNSNLNIGKIVLENDM